MPTPQELGLIRLCNLDVFQLTTARRKSRIQKYYGIGFLWILNGCSIYAVVYYVVRLWVIDHKIPVQYLVLSPKLRHIFLDCRALLTPL
ncbi:hypothetical protein [Nostoc sp. JL33]|uniref:hypothetical protein n=1 Tax=Nostoc sp. JL33 TaxID=2815396 RepID=UPI0025E5FE02|nr:hypothetical protein [Nostoc sp. JL33]MBN3868889.1 hypothetical protein [Nostoc sp. JL33]